MERIQDLITERNVFLGLNGADKESAFRQVVEALETSGRIGPSAGEALCAKLGEREKLSSTAIGRGIAIPHAYHDAVPEPMVVFARFDPPVDFQAPDGVPVDKMFLLAGPERDDVAHLQTIARLTRLLRDPRLLAGLTSAADPKEIIETIRTVENEH